MLKISVVFVLFYFCEGEVLVFDDVSDVLAVTLWTCFPVAIIASSFTFSWVSRHSREYAGSQQCMCLPRCAVEELCIMISFEKSVCLIVY